MVANNGNGEYGYPLEAITKLLTFLGLLDCYIASDGEVYQSNMAMVITLLWIAPRSTLGLILSYYSSNLIPETLLHHA